MKGDPSNVSWRKLNKRILALAFAWTVIGGWLTLAALELSGFIQVGDSRLTGWPGIVSRLKDGLFLHSACAAALGAVVAYVLLRSIGCGNYSARELAVTSQVTGALSCCC